MAGMRKITRNFSQVMQCPGYYPSFTAMWPSLEMNVVNTADDREGQEQLWALINTHRVFIIHKLRTSERLLSDHSGLAVWVTNYLHALEHWSYGFESQSRYVCLFILCLRCSVCRYRPCDRLITLPRSPTVCVKKITKLKKRPGPNKGL
jgi:hypothetical protein